MQKNSWDDILSNISSGFQNLGSSIGSKATQLGSSISQGFQQLRQPTQAPLAPLGQKITQGIQQLRQPVPAPIQIRTPNIRQTASNLGKAQLRFEQEHPLAGQFYRGVREAAAPIMQNLANQPVAGGLAGNLFPQLKKPLFSSDLVQKYRGLSQPERPGFTSAAARFAGETAAYLPAFAATEGMFNPITARLASKIPQGVSLAGRLLTSAGRGAIRTAPLGLTAALPYAETPQERLQRIPGAVAGAAAVGAVAGPVFTLAGIGLKSAWNKLVNQQRSVGGTLTPTQVREWAKGRYPIGFKNYLNSVADEADKLGKVVKFDEITGTTPTKAGRILKVEPKLNKVQATFIDSPNQIGASGGVTSPIPYTAPPTVPATPTIPTRPSIFPEVPSTPPIVSGTPFSAPPPTTPIPAQFRVVEPPVTGIQPREVIQLDKTKYEGVQTANAIVRPDGTGSIAIELKPEAQGKGLGTELVKELETILKDKGVTQVEIASVPESVGFWEKQGYVQTGQPAQAGLVNMQKALEAEPAGLKVEQASEKQITVEEATQAMGTLFSEEEIQFLTRGAKDIVTPDGKLAMGKTVGSIVEVVENKGKVSEKTVYHEGFHAYTQNFADPNLKQGAIEEAKSQQGFKTDQEAEEWLADSFADFMGARQTFTGRILSFFTNLWYSIRSLIGKVRQSEQLFRDIIDRKRPTITPEAISTELATQYQTIPGGRVPTFMGFQDLTTKIVERLKGKAVVSKQFIEDLTNMPELKQPERELIRSHLVEFGDQVPVKDFVDAVKKDLLPLEVKSGKTTEYPPSRNALRYENITLPNDLRGPVADYDEHLYSSPIETSAGQIHFPGETFAISGEEKYPSAPRGYFAHTRVEDLANPKLLDEYGEPLDILDMSPTQRSMVEKNGGASATRRVIELQSDLFQKGRLEDERYNNFATKNDIPRLVKSWESRGLTPEEIAAKKADLITKDVAKNRNAEIDRLESYRNTWQERIIREEIKQAAQDGKTKLQLPTGETAMKIEGLGERTGFTVVGQGDLTVETIKKKLWIWDGGGQHWVITENLGNGKFKATSFLTATNDYTTYQTFKNRGWLNEQEEFPDPENLTSEQIDILDRISEQFDISGKVDTENPIYKFYEKEVGRYLTNKYSAKRVTDPQGVEWYEIDIKLEQARQPVEAFRRYPEGQEPVSGTQILSLTELVQQSPTSIEFSQKLQLLEGPKRAAVLQELAGRSPEEFYNEVKGITTKPTEEIVEPEEIPETPTTAITKQLLPQEEIEQLIENIPADPVGARQLYDDLSSQYELPPFEELEQTASQVVRAEREIVDELKKEAGASDVTQLDQIGQFASTIRKAVREYKQITKRTGVVDIATMTEKNPELDGAINALKNNGIEVNTMEDLIALVPRLPVWRTRKAGVRVGKSKVARLTQLINSGATSEQLLSELESPMSPTRQAIRTRITRGISSEKIGVEGQLRYRFEETGEPILTEKAAFGETKGPSPEISKEIPAGQKILPETGVIHPKVMERLVANQVRKLRELRRRSGIKGKEFTQVIKQVTGKKTVTGLTYQEGQNLIDLMSPPQRQSLMGIVENIRTSQGDEKAQIIGNAILNIKNTSPLEEQYGLNKIFARGLEAVANMQNRLPSLPPLVSPPKGRKGAITQLYRTALSLPWVLLDTGRAAKFAGVFREVVAPIRAINNLAYEHVAGNYKTGMMEALKVLPKEGQTAVILKLNGFSDKIVQQKIGRTPNTQEKEYVKYFQEVEDNLFTFINVTRQLGNKKPMPYRKNHWPWILSQEVAEAMGAVVRGKAHLPRMMSKDAYLAGLFENDPEKVIDSRANALAYHTSNNLVDGLMKDRLGDASKVGVAAKMVADLVEARAVRRTADAISRIENAIGDAIDGVLGAFFYRTEKISPELQTEFKKTDFYNDPDNKEMIDAGELRLNQFKMPNVIGRGRDLIYLNLIGIKNFLFFPVNLTQTMIGIPFAGTQNWVRAYGDLAKIYLGFNKTNAKKLEKVLNDYNVMSLQGEPVAEGKISRLWKGVMKWGMATVVLSENINRPVSLFQGQYRTKEAAKQLGIELTQEEIEGGGAGLARDVEVVGGPGYAALASNSQLVGLMYQFSRFPIQMVDNMLTMAQRIFSKKKSAEMMQAHFIENPWGRAESIEAFEKDWEKLNMHEKREFAMGTMIMLGVLGTISVALTGSLVLLKRYAPFTTWLPNTNPIPLQLLQSAKEALSGDPEQIQLLKDRLNNFFNPVYFRRADDARQIADTGYIQNEKGQVMYPSPEGEDKKMWGFRVLFSGRSILPDYQQRERLYKKGLEQSKDRYERTKTFNSYVDKAEQIGKEQGLDAANNYLLSLPLESQDDLDKLMGIMEDRELRKGVTARQYQSLSAQSRAEAMYDELRGLDTQKHQSKLEEWLQQGLLSEDTMIELQKTFENPPEPTFMDKIFDAVNKLIGTKEASAAAPQTSLLSTIQQRKLDQKLKIYSPDVQEAMKLSESYNNIKSLETKYGGMSFGNALIEKEMQAIGMTEPQYQYAQLTELVDDLQYEEVLTRLEGLEGEEKLTTMSAMRVKSPYTRKALLTDTLINTMEKEGSIDETTADFLKDLDWDIKTQTFKDVPPKKAKKITFPKLSFKTVSLPKPTPIKVTKPQQFKPLQIKINKIPKPPSVRFTSSQFNVKTPSIRFPAMPTHLSGLGKVP